MKNKLTRLIELTSIRPGTPPKDIMRVTKLAIDTQCRAVVVNYQDLGLVQKVKQANKSQIQVVVVGGFPWADRTWRDTLSFFKKDWDEVDILIPISFYNLKENHDKFLNDYLDPVKKIGKPIKLILETTWLRATYKEYWQLKLEALTKYCIQNDLIVKTNSGLVPHSFDELVSEIKTIRKYNSKVRIKAAGGIKNLDQVKYLKSLGIYSIGTSSVELVNVLNKS